MSTLVEGRRNQVFVVRTEGQRIVGVQQARLVPVVAAGRQGPPGPGGSGSFSGLTKITVGPDEPLSPNEGDIWIDTN